MIKKIKKIKNLWIFSDYSWDTSVLNEFERFNVFYWWNGVGKTTLTKLFSWLESGKLDEFPELEYEIETSSWTIRQGDSFLGKIRVFNQKYIEDNIEIVGSKAKPIFILGEENKKIKDQIDVDESSLKEVKGAKKLKEDEKKKKESELGEKFTNVAKLIGANLVGSSTRNYRKPDAERDFQLLKSKNILSEKEHNEYLLALNEEQKDKIPEFTFGTNLSSIERALEDLFSQTVSSVLIERLKENPDISSWVEQGLSIHQTHKSKSCEFCQQDVPPSRLEELLSHFNEADSLLKQRIERGIGVIQDKLNELNSIIPPNKALFYSDLQTEYTSKIHSFNLENAKLALQLSSAIEKLKEKKGRTTEKMTFVWSLDWVFDKALSDANGVILKHNAKTDSFQIQKDNAHAKIKNHYLSEIYEEVNRLSAIILALEADIKSLGERENRLVEDIRKNSAIISSEHKACGLLNQKLETFLSRKDLSFEVSPLGGYVLKRGWKVAKNLSEWEKTAVAFVYFTVHLEDQHFDLSDWLVVIDDPISSLDSNSLFQAFAFLKTSVEHAKQVFILTHNFDFLRLLLNWVKNVKGKKSYYMIDGKVINDSRAATLKTLDKLLSEHESEYHYLCKVLFEFKTDWTIASVYHIPNIARKALETFLMFRVPSMATPYAKLESLTSFDKAKRASIYKFTNSQSHITGQGFDPSLVPETQKNVAYLLELIKETSPDHYSILVDSFSSPANWAPIL